MWGIVGLGNPGRKYAKTRHNIGFVVLEELCRRIGAELSEKPEYKIARGSIEGERALFLEPLTFMNLSGTVVRDVFRNNPVETSRLIVIHDDIDLPTGRLRVRAGGSSGGHRGVESIIQCIGTREFVRVRIGVGRDADRDVKDFVLSGFRPDEQELVGEAVHEACSAVSAIIKLGLTSAMNKFNKRTKSGEAPASAE